MIISASRRTDIPAAYADWFFARWAAGWCRVQNPYNPRQARRVSLLPQDVDGLVFWTKNPAPMLARLPLLGQTPYYFHCTLTGAGRRVEPGLPNKRGTVLPAVVALCRAVGPQRVVWRFDPLVFGGPYTPEAHAGQFAAIARVLAAEGVNTCVFSFYAPYAAANRRMAAAGLRGPTAAERDETARLLAAEARRWGLALQHCAGEAAWPGVAPAVCVDAVRLAGIAGHEIPAVADKHQRPHCRCAASVDIGAYGTCPLGCVYCYATRGAVRRAVPPDAQGMGPLLPASTAP